MTKLIVLFSRRETASVVYWTVKRRPGGFGIDWSRSFLRHGWSSCYRSDIPFIPSVVKNLMGSLPMTKLVIFLVLKMIFHGESPKIRPFWQSEALFWLFWLKSGYIGIPSDLKIFPALKIWSINPLNFSLVQFMFTIFLEYFASCKYSNATQEGRRGGGFKWKAEVHLQFKTSMI